MTPGNGLREAYIEKKQLGLLSMTESQDGIVKTEMFSSTHDILENKGS
jgi:hypothetical protein